MRVTAVKTVRTYSTGFEVQKHLFEPGELFPCDFSLHLHTNLKALLLTIVSSVCTEHRPNFMDGYLNE